MTVWQMLEFWSIGWGLFLLAHLARARYLEYLAKNSVKRLNTEFGRIFATLEARNKPKDGSKEILQ